MHEKQEIIACYGQAAKSQLFSLYQEICTNVIYQYSLTSYTFARRHTEAAVQSSHSQSLIQGHVNSNKPLVDQYPASHSTLPIIIYKFNY